MTRELNVRITLGERDGHYRSDDAYLELIESTLIRIPFIESVQVQVETVKPAKQEGIRPEECEHCVIDWDKNPLCRRYINSHKGLQLPYDPDDSCDIFRHGGGNCRRFTPKTDKK